MPSPNGDPTTMTLDVDISRDAKAPWHARRAVEKLGTAIDPQLKGDVMLLVSELVTNSVKYGGHGDLRLQIEAPAPKRLRLEGVDQGGGFETGARRPPARKRGGEEK